MVGGGGGSSSPSTTYPPFPTPQSRIPTGGFMPIVPHLDNVPLLGRDVYLAPTAYVIGKVRLGDRCSVWYGATVRGDSGAIEIGDEVSIQEAATVHTEDQRPV